MSTAAAPPIAATAAAAAAAPTSQAESHEQLLRQRLKKAETNAIHWRQEGEREQMQLAAFLDGEARRKKLNLPVVSGRDDTVICYEDPDPDIDRLHVKVWPGGIFSLPHEVHLLPRRQVRGHRRLAQGHG